MRHLTTGNEFTLPDAPCVINGSAVYLNKKDYDSFAVYKENENKFYIEHNDGRTHWETEVTPDDLRNMARLMDIVIEKNKDLGSTRMKNWDAIVSTLKSDKFTKAAADGTLCLTLLRTDGSETYLFPMQATVKLAGKTGPYPYNRLWLSDTTVPTVHPVEPHTKYLELTINDMTDVTIDENSITMGYDRKWLFLSVSYQGDILFEDVKAICIKIKQ